MTSTQITPEATSPAVAVGETPPRTENVGLARLTRVELRKLADTRSGLWLLIVIGLVALGTAAILLIWGKDSDQTFQQFFTFGLLPTAVLLPVLGILSMTSEWSQRTALSTFTLVPARGKVIAAKLVAGVLVAVAATVVTAGIAALATLLGGAIGGSGSWSIGGVLLAQCLLAEVVAVLMGLGFGALLMNSALAIVVYFALPTVWSILTSTISGLKSVAPWLDLNDASMPMTEHGLTTTQWAHLGVATAIWVVVPLVLGTIRAMRREVA
jgi:ABC-type transport system involved in multi-copper enzyme maturation permease subunit